LREIVPESRTRVDAGTRRVDPDRPTGTAVILVDEQAHNCIVVVAGASAGLSAADVQEAIRVIETADVVVAQLETPLDATREAFQIARAAGTYVQLVGRDAGYAILRLNSGETRMVPAACMASVGAVSNPDNSNINLGKAGRMRWKGKRPTVRGVAMNPIDHPHGGGEGKTSGGRHPVSPWGKPEGRTRKAHKPSDKLIVRRRRTGKKHHR